MYNEKLLSKDDFLNELQDFVSKERLDMCERLFGIIPNYFWLVPASSTGKYHPSFSCRTGGLTNHTLAAMKIFKRLAKHFEVFNEDIEIGLIALTFHDTFKLGPKKERYTVHKHPLYAAVPFITLGENKIAECIKSHMGRFNKNNYSNIILPLPEDDLQMLVHIADYLSSRKEMEDDLLTDENGFSMEIAIDFCSNSIKETYLKI